MIKKLFWLIILFFTIYIVILIKLPETGKKLGELLGTKQLNQNIILIKDKVIEIGKKAPTKEEIENFYSGAVNTVQQTKEEIDKIRKKAGELEETIDETKQNIEEIKKVYENGKETLEEINKSIKNINNTNTGITK